MRWSPSWKSLPAELFLGAIAGDFFGAGTLKTGSPSFSGSGEGSLKWVYTQ